MLDTVHTRTLLFPAAPIDSHMHRSQGSLKPLQKVSI